MTIQVWTEKYRPQKLSEIKGQENITSRLQAFVKSESMPHLLFAGPAGVGKTTAALAISREIYGKTWQDNVLELNASDERGIDVIRIKVKDFARTRAIEEVPFKIIYLDEADALTRDAQSALRRIMEDYSTTTRFILACNYSSKIILPIQSRCAVFRFRPLSKEHIIEILQSIAEEEELKLESEAVDFIYEASEGDCRKAENILQASSAVSSQITLKVIEEVVSFAEPQEIAKVISLALKGRFVEAKNKIADIMIEHGLSGLDAIKQIQKQSWLAEVDDKKKVELIKACGEYEFRLVEGANEFIQLNALLAEFVVIGAN